MKLDTHQLRYFLAVAEELHFGRAARRLNMSQPPLSQQIRLLENALGVRLFERTRRSVELTTPGKLLLAHTVPMLAALHDLAELVQAAARGEAGLLRVGYTAASASHLVPSIVRAFKRQYPEVELILHERISSEQVQELSDHRLDIGLLRPCAAPSDVIMERLIVDQFLLALPVDHPLARHATVDTAWLHDVEFIGFAADAARYFHGMISAFLNQADIQPRIVHRATQSHTVLAFVGAGLGVAIIPATATLVNIDGVVYRPLQGKHIPKPEFDLCWRRDAMTPLIANFIACAKEATNSYVPGVLTR